ncbi:UDP-N-acetylmuramate dehydrogenase [Kiloniella sp. b19]|uniref:UDP-N-acetylmuramate dehydrogenase n=1 Tax=Kiloniella sp. GXU_MW_B19 TaxID=3141326 RepID=UPI0031E1057A
MNAAETHKRTATGQDSGNPLLTRLPAVRGELRSDTPLARLTWFKVGGPCDVLFTPADQDDLVDFLRNTPTDIPVMPIGVGSNLLVRDGGLEGVVIRLGPAFAGVSHDGDYILAGAAAQDVKASKAALKAGLTGLEFLSGIPGTIGGALRMNAGAYGRETRDVLVWAEAVNRDGEVRRFTPDELGYSYRHCDLSGEWIFLRACLRGQPGDPEAIETRIRDIQTARGETQPIKSRTGGSTFKNPEGHKAWQLIDAAGCRGFSIGDAQMSEQHCNFMINRDKATAAQLEEVGETVRKRVLDQSGVELHWEIKRIGRTEPKASGSKAPGKDTE